MLASGAGSCTLQVQLSGLMKGMVISDWLQVRGILAVG